MPIAIIASQTRLVQVMEKFYGDNAFTNTALAEYKRAIEALDKESKDNLVILGNCKFLDENINI